MTIDIFKCFEFQRIARWVEKKHCALFPGLARKPYMGFYQKLRHRRLDSIYQSLPSGKVQYNTKMRHWHLMAVHCVAQTVVSRLVVLRGVKVHHQLVSKHIEIYPMLRAAALGKAEGPAVELASLGYAPDGNGEVKRWP